MRFDDSLETVLAAEIATPFGMQSAWRQLVDLIGRRRVPPSAAALARLRRLRADVAPPVRAASARALAYANPPAALVELFASDEVTIAAPVLRVAQLRSDEWTAILPQMSAATRAVLRHRRDLHADVQRALSSFGPSDFILPGALPDDEARPALSLAPDAIAQPLAMDDLPATEPPVLQGSLERDLEGNGPSTPAEAPVVERSEIATIDWTEVVAPMLVEMDRRGEDRPAPEPFAQSETAASIASPASGQSPPALITPPQSSETPFMSVASVAKGLPVVAEALRLAGSEAEPPEPAGAQIAGADAAAKASADDGAPSFDTGGFYNIADPDDAENDEPLPPSGASPAPTATEGAESEVGAAAQSSDSARSGFEIAELVARIDAYQKRRDDHVAAPVAAPVPATAFRFSTDEQGVIRWVSGVERGPLIGLSLAYAVGNGAARVDGGVTGAFRRRAAISDARLIISGESDAAGQWRISAVPAFDERSGRFAGYRGTARRPRRDEGAEPLAQLHDPGADALRQLVHELRTPTNAIAGFAEMIDREMLGPVSALYRRRAQDIRTHAADLIAAIEDLDFAARVETHALDLREDIVAVGPLLARTVEDLNPLLTLRGAAIVPAPVSPDLAIHADARVAERLAGRLLAALAAAAGRGERLALGGNLETPETVAITVDRPAALADREDQALFAADAEAEAGEQGAPLLGTGFALRLARNLATELGGALAVEPHRLTLRLPAAFSSHVGQASSN